MPGSDRASRYCRLDRGSKFRVRLCELIIIVDFAGFFLSLFKCFLAYSL